MDGQMDGWTDDHGKNNMSPNPEVGRHNYKSMGNFADAQGHLTL